jgi:GTP 3',8-cyclase
MKDALGREINYIRFSLTERCNLRCIYCQPDGEDANNKELSAANYIRIAKVFAELGGTKIRLTGGEPLLRKDLEEIISGINKIGAYKDICMTTNAHGLADRMEGLKAAGLNRLNISIDTLNPEKYTEMTRGGKIEEVFSAVDKAILNGMTPVKLNAVVVRGKNDTEVGDFFSIIKDRPIEVRFIELMPIGEFGEDIRNQVSTEELIARYPELKLLPRRQSQTSQDYTLDGHMGKIGFISPLSDRFCDDCNKIRITSDGNIRTCLGSNIETSIIEALGKSDEELKKVFEKAIFEKHPGHSFDAGFESTRTMNRIGG